MTIEMRPRNFELVWTDEGDSLKGAHFTEAVFFETEWVKNVVHSIKDLTPEVLRTYVDKALQSLINERDTLAESLQAVEYERDGLAASLKTMTEENARLSTLLNSIQDAPQ